MQNIEIFGIKFSNLDKKEVLSVIETLIKRKEPSLIITANPLTILSAYKNKSYFEVLKKAKLILADGIGIILVSWILGKKIKQRIPGIDLIPEIFKLAEEKNYRIFLLGSKEEIIEKAQANLKKTYPKANIVGFHHGYFENDGVVLEKIINSKPDILLVGLGQPEQEEWIAKNLDKIKVPVNIGVGGSFDVISGFVKRAPVFIRKIGLEWLYRFIQNPPRLKKLFKK